MKSSLVLKTAYAHGQTEIEDLYFDAPYKIMSPFRQGRRTEVMQMCASAGMLSGDVFDLSVQAGRGCDLLYTSQSYEKIFASRGEQTVKRTRLEVEQGGALYYMPHPVIPFAESDFYGENQIRIHPSARLLYCDIFNCGRVAMGERYRMKRFCSKTRVYIGGKLVFADHTLLDPQKFRYDSLGLWGEYTHNGLLYLYLGEYEPMKSLQERIRSLCPDGIQAGCTEAGAGIVLRALGMRGEEVFKYFKDIAQLCYEQNNKTETGKRRN